MDIKLTNPPVQAPDIQTPQSTTIPEGLIINDEVGSLFDLTRNEIGRMKSKIAVLIEYAKLKSEDHTPGGIKWALRSLSMKLGTPPMGEKLINYLTRYAYLYLETHKMKKELAKYEKGDDGDN